MIETNISFEQLYKEAEMAALLAHKGQTYDIFPYEKHLRDVVELLKRYGYSGVILIAAWLHDSIEDSTLTHAKIKNAFGIEIAELVYAVTDELGRNRKERKEKTLPKIKAYGEDAITLKLGDRIVNLEHSIRMGNTEAKMYEKEYSQFKEALYTPGTKAEPLWEHLSSLIVKYRINSASSNGSINH